MEYKVIIELYNDDGKYKADYFERTFDSLENALNHTINILNEIINDKQLDYKCITVLENNLKVNQVIINK